MLKFCVVYYYLLVFVSDVMTRINPYYVVYQKTSEFKEGKLTRRVGRTPCGSDTALSRFDSEPRIISSYDDCLIS